MQRSRRNLKLALVPFCLVLVTNVMVGALSAGAASAGYLDGYRECNNKVGRANDLIKKDTESLLRLFKKAKNADMHKTEPVKYCDWHKKNVMAVLIKSIRRMGVLAKDPQCFNDPVAVNSYERLVQNYKQDERWMSSLCLGIQPY